MLNLDGFAYSVQDCVAIELGRHMQTPDRNRGHDPRGGDGRDAASSRGCGSGLTDVYEGRSPDLQGKVRDVSPTGIHCADVAPEL